MEQDGSSLMLDITKRRSPAYSDNSDRCKGTELPCVLCGKPVINARYWVHLHGGGYTLVTEAEVNTLNSAEDLGAYPIGPTCLKANPEIRLYLIPKNNLFNEDNS